MVSLSSSGFSLDPTHCGPLYPRYHHQDEKLMMNQNKMMMNQDKMYSDKMMMNQDKMNPDKMMMMRRYGLRHCQYCSRGFADKISLVRHERTHTGEKPFNCRHCYYSSTQHGNLMRHVRTKHPEFSDGKPKPDGKPPGPT